MPGHTQPWETSSPPSSHGEPAFQLVVQFYPAPQAPSTKPAGSPSSGVTRVPWVPLLSSSVQMPISSKTTVSCQFPAILCLSGPCVRRETGCFPGRTVCLVFLLSLGDSPSSQTSPSPGKAFSLISLSFLCLPWWCLSRTARGVPVLGSAVGCWKCLLGILSSGSSVMSEPRTDGIGCSQCWRGRWPQVCLK